MGRGLVMLDGGSKVDVDNISLVKKATAILLQDDWPVLQLKLNIVYCDNYSTSSEYRYGINGVLRVSN